MLSIRDAIVFIILFGSNLLQAITGFAGTLIAMPPTIKLIGVNEAKALLTVIAQATCLMIVVTGFSHINWKEFGKMFVCMIIVIVLKKLLFTRTNKVQEADNTGESEKRLPSWFMIIILLAAGIIHGMFVSGGALLVVYASAVLRDKEEFRVTVAMMWLTTGFYMTGTQIMLGNFTLHTIIILVIGLIPAFVGTYNRSTPLTLS